MRGRDDLGGLVLAGASVNPELQNILVNSLELRNKSEEKSGR